MTNFVQLNAGLNSGVDIAGKLMDHGVQRERNQLMRDQLDHVKNVWETEQRDNRATRAAKMMSNSLAQERAALLNRDPEADPNSITFDTLLANNEGLRNQVANDLLFGSDLVKSQVPKGGKVGGYQYDAETGDMVVSILDAKGNQVNQGRVPLSKVSSAAQAQATAYGFIDAYNMMNAGLAEGKDMSAFMPKYNAIKAAAEVQGIPTDSVDATKKYIADGGATKTLTQPVETAVVGAPPVDPEADAQAVVDAAQNDPSRLNGDPSTQFPGNGEPPKKRSMLPSLGSNLPGAPEQEFVPEPEGGIYAHADVTGTLAQGAGYAAGAIADASYKSLTGTGGYKPEPSTAVNVARKVNDWTDEQGSRLIGKFTDGFKDGVGSDGAQSPDKPAPQKKAAPDIDEFVSQTLEASKGNGEYPNVPPGARFSMGGGSVQVPAYTDSSTFSRQVTSAPPNIKGNKKVAAMYASAMYAMNGQLSANDMDNVANLTSFGDMKGQVKMELGMRYRELMSAEIQHAENYALGTARLRAQGATDALKMRDDGYKRFMDRATAAAEQYALVAGDAADSDRAKFRKADYIYRVQEVASQANAWANAGFTLNPYTRELDYYVHGNYANYVADQAIRSADAIVQSAKNEGINLGPAGRWGGRDLSMKVNLGVFSGLPASKVEEVINAAAAGNSNEVANAVQSALMSDPNLLKTVVAYSEAHDGNVSPDELGQLVSSYYDMIKRRNAQ